MHPVDEPDLLSGRAGARLSTRHPHGSAQAALPRLSRSLVQVVYATFASLAVAGGWLASDRIFGAFLGFALLMVPIVNAPFAICLAFIAVSTFRIPEVFPPLLALRLPELTAVGALGTLIWHVFLTRRIRPFWSRGMTLFALFSLHVAICVVFAADRPAALEAWTSQYVKVSVITLALAWLCVGPRQFALSAVVFMLCGLTVGSVALWNKAHGIGLVEGGRVTIGRDLGSSIGDPNDLALVLLFALAFCLGLALTRGVPTVLRLLGLASTGVVLAAVVATQSRGGMLGAAAVFIPFLRNRIRSRFVLAALAALSIVVLYSLSGIGERDTVVVEAGSNLDASARGRLLAWEAAIRMALADPLTGVGMQNFHLLYYFYTDEWQGKAVAAHSMWFQVLGENGFVGLALLIALMSVTAGSLLRAHRRLGAGDCSVFARTMTISLLAAFCGVAVSGSFLSQAYGWPIGITLALSFAISRYAASAVTNSTPGTNPSQPSAMPLHARSA